MARTKQTARKTIVPIGLTRANIKAGKQISKTKKSYRSKV
jgi:hypothetical protein